MKTPSQGRLGLTRRVFLAGTTGLCPLRRSFVLEAIAAERMPHRIVVWGVPASTFFELREYGVATAGLIRVLSRHGIRPVLAEEGRLLVPFESLAEREQAWRRVSGDREWIGLGARVAKIAVYRMV